MDVGNKKLREDWNLSLSDLGTQLNTIAEHLTHLLALPDKINSIEDHLTDIKEDNKNVHKSLIHMDKRVSSLEAENISLKNELRKLRESHLENMQYQRSNNLIKY